jgi:ABC-2 type transport system permease protein
MRPLAAKYWTIFVICLAERLTYRTDFFFGTLMRFLPIVTTIFLWGAVFSGSQQSQIGGFNAHEIVAYYLLVLVGRAFSSMPGLAAGIAKDVRDGNVKKYLIQPVDMVGFLLTMRLAHKVVYYAIAIGPFVIVFALCRRYFPAWPPPTVLCAFGLSLVLAFLIGFLFEMLIGLLAFWFLEISSFGFIIMTLNYVLSGHMFPLDLFPDPIAHAMQWLPFAYMAYFPAKLFLSGASWTAGALWSALAIQALYAAALLAIVRVVFRRGVRRYSAFGG